MNYKNYLFNFSASYRGGGYKRLYEFVSYFNENGGANFILHPNCKKLQFEFPNNTYFFIEQTKWDRIFIENQYLKDIIRCIPKIDFYYSYGIAIYSKIAKLNWFHLSNVLPLFQKNIPLTLMEKMRMSFLGYRIRKNFKNADVISAESNYSLELIKNLSDANLVLSVNGSDDELSNLSKWNKVSKGDFAVILGTYKYKAVGDSVKIFIHLKKNNPNLKLVIIGDSKCLSKELFKNDDIIIKGLLSRKEVFKFLKEAKYYISTTYIENSYNAASEGIFFADESYISNIEPHKELLENMKFELVKLDNLDREIIYIKRDQVSTDNVKVWRQVISDMIRIVQEKNNLQY